jgi:hypothetical protein
MSSIAYSDQIIDESDLRFHPSDSTINRSNRMCMRCHPKRAANPHQSEDSLRTPTRSPWRLTGLAPAEAAVSRPTAAPEPACPKPDVATTAAAVMGRAIVPSCSCPESAKFAAST